ncbi:hypothetical protein STEG23_015407, partial [Scotinomys teguina]
LSKKGTEAKAGNENFLVNDREKIGLKTHNCHCARNCLPSVNALALLIPNNTGEEEDEDQIAYVEFDDISDIAGVQPNENGAFNLDEWIGIVEGVRIMHYEMQDAFGTHKGHPYLA